MDVKMHDDEYEDCSLHWRVSCMNLITQEDDSRKKMIFFSRAKRRLTSYDLIEFFTNEQYMSADSLVLQVHERGWWGHFQSFRPKL